MNYHLTLTLSLMFLSRAAIAEPFDELKGSHFNEMSKRILREIVPPRDEMAVDDHIIALSKASEMNFIADVTHVPADNRTQPFPATNRAKKWKPAFYNVLGDFKGANQLSSLRYDETTYLFWDKPDVMETARLIIAAGKHRPMEALPGEMEVHRALEEYAKQNPQLPNTPDMDRPVFYDIRLGDVPSKLKSQITALARQEILRPDVHWELLFTDDFWKKARLSILPQLKATDGERKILQIEGRDENEKLPHWFFIFIGLRAGGNIPYGSIYLNPPAVLQSLQTPRATAPEAAVLPPQSLTASQLEGEEPLKVKVQLEVKRRSLRELLNIAAPQAGVALVVDEDVTARNALVTARVREMPLGALMGALTRLDGLHWTKEGPTRYVLHNSKLSELQTLIMRSGKGEFSTKGATWEEFEDQNRQFDELEREIVAGLNQIKNMPPEGFAFTALPEELQGRLRTAFEEFAASKITHIYTKAWKFVSDSAVLRVASRSYTLLINTPETRLGRTPETDVPPVPMQFSEWQVRVKLPDFTREFPSDTLMSISLKGARKQNENPPAPNP